MSQGFQCTCEEKECLGHIQGAKHLTNEQVEGLWLNKHIRELHLERNVNGQINGQQETVPKVAAVAN